MMHVTCSECETIFPVPPGTNRFRCPICRPATFNRQPPLPPPSSHGGKKAVICGVSYRRTRYELKGSINDAKSMKHLLLNNFNFPHSSILMLTEETNPYMKPTKANIRMALSWLVQGCQRGDSLLFHYSGHGSQQKDYTGDELDGYDETIVPMDFEKQGMIIDDEINETIVRPLPYGVKLHAIVDSSHSGTVLDLPFLCRMNSYGQYEWEDHRPRSGTWKGTSGGEVVAFSGCDDDQQSADTSTLCGASAGVMTVSFIQAIERGQGTTYGNILNSMRSSIRNSSDQKRGIGGAFIQEPQLTACEPFDVYSKPFYL
ncbi:Metacaspase-1 [Acorus calamus]|uniref:Metacaspase-1 n=1 Tax=Acorus calamus TaxID=4465 RepID=A0AAV9FJ93_ACOCL|nr:Metacaspase-1 [Acorus calamus]